MIFVVLKRLGVEVLSLRVEGERAVLGRGSGCDVVIPDPRVSRRQAELSFAGGKAWIEDLSGRGTLIAGERVTRRVPWEQGVEVSLGKWTAEWRSQPPPEQAAETVERPVDEAQATQVAPTNGKPEPSRVVLRIRYAGKEQARPFEGSPLTLGKDSLCDVVLEDAFVSGQHLKVGPSARQSDLFHVEDLHSTNGTYLGAVRVYEADVPLRTCIRLGETELVIDAPGGREGPGGRSSVDGELGLVGHAPALKDLLEVIERIAPSNAAVAVFGESGSGKELVARAIHSKSARTDGPFIPLNCAAISRSLAESELFGHEKGAFTGASSTKRGAFEEADGGTLFLDEVGELPLELQATLLRALESGEVKRVGATRPTHVDVRVVTATNVDLYRAVREGRFREDLYYRLCVVPVHVPPLRARLSDVPALAEHFLKTFSPAGPPAQLKPEAYQRLQSHRWPGNVRELRNVIHRALLLRKGSWIEPEDILFDEPRETHEALVVGRSSLVGRRSTNDKPSTMNPVVPTLDEAIAALERELVDAALKRHGGNRERAAKELGLARSSLFKRLREWGLTGRGEDA